MRTFILCLSLLSLAFLNDNAIVELASFVRAHGDKDVRRNAKNEVGVLSKGTLGKVEKVESLSKGASAVKLKILDGSLKEKSIWVYYSPQKPSLKLYGNEKPNKQKSEVKKLEQAKTAESKFDQKVVIEGVQKVESPIKTADAPPPTEKKLNRSPAGYNLIIADSDVNQMIQNASNAKKCPTCDYSDESKADAKACKENFKIQKVKTIPSDGFNPGRWIVLGDKAYFLSCRGLGVGAGFSCAVSIYDSNGNRIKSLDGEYYFKDFPGEEMKLTMKDGSLPLFSKDKNEVSIVSSSGVVTRKIPMGAKDFKGLKISENNFFVQTSDDAINMYTASGIKDDHFSLYVKSNKTIRHVVKTNSGYAIGLLGDNGVSSIYLVDDSGNLVTSKSFNSEFETPPLALKNGNVLYRYYDRDSTGGGEVKVLSPKGELHGEIHFSPYTRVPLKSRVESVPVETKSGTIVTGRDGNAYSVDSNGTSKKILTSQDAFDNDPIFSANGDVVLTSGSKLHLLKSSGATQSIEMGGENNVQPVLLSGGVIMAGTSFKGSDTKYQFFDSNGRLVASYVVEDWPSAHHTPQSFSNGNVIIMDQSRNTHIIRAEHDPSKTTCSKK